MTADAPNAPPPTPRWTPSPGELDDLDMLLRGAYPGCPGFGRRDDDPAAPELVVPASVARQALAAGELVLLDEQGVPVACLAPVTSRPGGPAGSHALDGPVRGLGEQPRGSHSALRVPAPGPPPAGAVPVLGVPLDRPLPPPLVVQLRAAADALGARLLLLPLTGAGRPRGVDGPTLVRACLTVRELVGADVVPLAVPRRPALAAVDDERLLRRVARAYGATHVAGPAVASTGGDVPAGPGPEPPAVLPLAPVTLDRRSGRWRAEAEVPVEHRSPRSSELLADALGPRAAGAPPGGRRGFAVLLTGLSGSGKSTIASALHDAILERSDRSVSLLDGDVVRRMLSSELTFSREHRALNVRRIGFVATEVARHGGIALCAAIAPYDDARREFRSMVEATGAGVVLVHVATPIEVCERRDRKGLYAQARAGAIPGFTGISAPYEVPGDAEVVADTSVTGVAETVERVLDVVGSRGWLLTGSRPGDGCPR